MQILLCIPIITPAEPKSRAIGRRHGPPNLRRLRQAGIRDLRFVDAMTNDLSENQVRQIPVEEPDFIGVTAITPSIYKAERLLQIAKEVHPLALTVLGGIHATFMYQQVLTEAPWIDAIVRGEGEEIFVNLFVARRRPLAGAAAVIKGLAFRDNDSVVATPAAPTVKDLDAISPDWGILEWSKYIYIPMGKRVAIPNMARGCPFTCSFCSQWKFWRDYRIRDPKKVVDEIEGLIRDHDVGFFHPGRRGADDQQEEVRGLLRRAHRADLQICGGSIRG